MLPGFGLFRRFVTLALVAGAFWVGMHFARSGLDDRCVSAGGTVRADGLCGGLR